MKRKVFWAALWLKAWLCELNLPGPGKIYELVFKGVKQEICGGGGRRLRACFTVAGPIGRETRRFISFVFVPFISGYA